MKMEDKHFTMSSEILFGELLVSISSKKLEELSFALSRSNLNSSCKIARKSMSKLKFVRMKINSIW